MEIYLFALKIVISLLPVFLFFTVYFRNFVFRRSILWQSKSFFFGMLSSVLVATIHTYLPDTESSVLRAFGYAALLEESIRYIVIAARVLKSSEEFSIMEGVFDGILVGLGFAFVENLSYSIAYPGPVILLRCLSSVPLHVFSAGIMGFFISYSHLCLRWRSIGRLNRNALRKIGLAALGLLFPVVYHGTFDFVLFQGKRWDYALPFLLIGGYAYLEYLIARAQLLPGKNILRIIGLGADDMDIIQKEQEYEKWVEDFQEDETEKIPLFLNEWSLLYTVFAAALVLFAGGMLLMHFWSPQLLFDERDIPREVRLALLVWLPFSIALILLLADKVNYLYFRENMLRLPGALPIFIKAENFQTDALVLDVFPGGVFLPEVFQLKPGDRVTLEIHYGDQRIPAQGRIKWVNQKIKKLPRGALLQFHRSGKGFLWFLVSHGFRKLRRRVRLVWRKL